MTNELRSALPTDKDRKAAGRALRDQIRRGDLGLWKPKEDRSDPVDLVEEAHSGRLERLVPVRIGRMVASPYRVPPRCRRDHGRGLREPAGDRHPAGHLR